MIKMLETTVSDLKMELGSTGLAKVDIWKGDDDDVATGQVTGT